MSDKKLKYKITADGSAFNKAMSDAVNQTGQLDNRMSNISKGGLMSAVAGGIYYLMLFRVLQVR